MFDLSDRLLLIAGAMEPLSKTGGSMTAQEVEMITAALRGCAAAARQLTFDAAWAQRQLDEIVDDAAQQARLAAPVRAPVRRRLRVIEGGRA
jgi:hypothetical protein